MEYYMNGMVLDILQFAQIRLNPVLGDDMNVERLAGILRGKSEHTQKCSNWLQTATVMVHCRA